MEQRELITAAEIYLVRHGQTEWNACGRMQGALDSPLTDRGRAQAQAAGEKLAAILSPEEDVALCISPLGRTRATAALIAEARPYSAIVEDERLREVSLGSWDGLSYYEIDQEWPGAIDGATVFDWFFRSPDGERLEAALERARSWLSGLSGTVVAVSHGLIGRIIRGAYLDLPTAEMLQLSGSPETVWHLSRGEMKDLPTSEG